MTLMKKHCSLLKQFLFVFILAFSFLSYSSENTASPQKDISDEKINLGLSLRHDLPNPNDFVIQVYSIALAVMTDISSDSNMNNYDFNKKVFSEKLLKLFEENEKLQAKSSGAPCINWDPLLNTQDVPMGFVITNSKENKNNHWTYIIAYMDGEKLKDTLEVTVIREKNLWKIDDVVLISKNSKNKSLSSNLKECIKSN